MLSGINESETAEASDPKVRLDLYKACILLNQYLNRDSLTLCASVLNLLEGHLVINGRINGKEVKIMVDSGAQANFVGTSFMQEHLRDTATPFGKAIVDVQGGLLVARHKTLHSDVQLEIEGFQPTELSMIGIPNIIYNTIYGLPFKREEAAITIFRMFRRGKILAQRTLCRTKAPEQGIERRDLSGAMRPKTRGV